MTSSADEGTTPSSDAGTTASGDAGTTTSTGDGASDATNSGNAEADGATSAVDGSPAADGSANTGGSSDAEGQADRARRSDVAEPGDAEIDSEAAAPADAVSAKSGEGVTAAEEDESEGNRAEGTDANADTAVEAGIGAAAQTVGVASAAEDEGSADGEGSAEDDSAEDDSPEDEGSADGEGTAEDDSAEDDSPEDEGSAAGEGSAEDEGSADGDAAEGQAEEPVERPRPTVGVVYEPDESPDGFPAEYGDIIIGLPKPIEAKSLAAAAEPAAAFEQIEASDQADRSHEVGAPGQDAISVAESAERKAAKRKQSGSEDSRAGDDGLSEAQGVTADPSGSGETVQVEDAQTETAPAEAAPVDEAGSADEADAVERGDPIEEQEQDAVGKADAVEEVDAIDVVRAKHASGAGLEAEETPADEHATPTDEDATGGANASDAKGNGAEDGEAEGGAARDGGAQDGDAGGEGAGAQSGDAVGAAAAAAGAESESESAEETATEQATMALITALMRLRGALASSKLPIDVVGADEARRQQKAMLDQLDDYILPRLVQIEAPVLAVVGGSTGAGKSTLVNTLTGQLVSEPGVLRPTTRSPVLIHNPVDAEWFTGERVLPGLARSSGEKPGGIEDPGSIRLVAADTVPQGLAILDAPDVDSVVEANRELATQLLAAADLWLFVTTAARYSDAVPWDFLTRAAGRSTAVAVVLDRAPTDTVDDISGHLAQMLLEQGLGDSPLFSIPETVVDGNGMLPAELVVSIKDWLTDLAADADARSAVVRRTLQGAVTAMTKKTPAFATAVRAQADTIVELRSNAETEYEQAVKDVAKATQDGTMLRGEVLARWQEFVGTGELLKGLQTNVGRMRDKMKSAVVGKSPPTRNLNDAVESGLESLLREHAEAAAERAQASWQSTVAGRQLLALGDRDLGRMSKTFPAEASHVVRDWQGFVLDLIRKEGAKNRSTAKILAYGVNGLGLALTIVIFASTADTTGGEAGAGTAVVGRKLLEAVFGNRAVRSLAAKAREDLDSRVHALMDAEFARYLAVLDQHPVDPDAPRRLTEAARAVEDCT